LTWPNTRLLQEIYKVTDSFSWLHLTDFHYGLKGQGCLWPNLREPFLESLKSLHEKCGPWPGGPRGLLPWGSHGSVRALSGIRLFIS